MVRLRNEIISKESHRPWVASVSKLDFREVNNPMYFESLSDFLAMGGYSAYVWSAFWYYLCLNADPISAESAPW